jgi:CDP-diacylglycerol pyrophosphatase
VRRVDGERLDAVNPITDIAAHVPGAAADMGAIGIGVVAMNFKSGQPGFVLMATRRDDSDPTSGIAEHDIQEHDCIVVKGRPSAEAGLPVKP